MSSSALTGLCRHPIVQAPMAGGASCPQLAAAVSETGGLGFLAAGYKTADGMYEEIKQVRGLTARPFGVNLFMPQPGNADPAAVGVYRVQLAGESTWYETPLGDPDRGRDDGYDAKLAILLDDPVPVVSFTFGCPPRSVLESFGKAGTFTIVTVTTPEEAQAAQWAGADAVCVQGIEAGGHQGTHRDDPSADGSGYGLLALLALVKETVQMPVIAAGGLMRGSQIAAVLAAGASAAQLGTAFLVCPESAAHPLHKQAMTNPLFVRTEMTRAFLRASRAGPGEQVHAGARTVRARRVPRGAPSDERTAQGRGEGGRRAGHVAVGGPGAPAGAGDARRPAGRGARRGSGLRTGRAGARRWCV
ncbi:LOW QUALITY PROTEIN: dioxygenase, partial [Streptomyces pristinaespiralis ATCC 25486]